MDFALLLVVMSVYKTQSFSWSHINTKEVLCKWAFLGLDNLSRGYVTVKTNIRQSFYTIFRKTSECAMNKNKHNTINTLQLNTYQTDTAYMYI